MCQPIIMTCVGCDIGQWSNDDLQVNLILDHNVLTNLKSPAVLHCEPSALHKNLGQKMHRELIKCCFAPLHSGERG